MTLVTIIFLHKLIIDHSPRLDRTPRKLLSLGKSIRGGCVCGLEQTERVWGPLRGSANSVCGVEGV